MMAQKKTSGGYEIALSTLLKLVATIQEIGISVTTIYTIIIVAANFRENPLASEGDLEVSIIYP